MKKFVFILITFLPFLTTAQVYHVGDIPIYVEGIDENFTRSVSITNIVPGVDELEIKLEASQMAMPNPIVINYKLPSIDIQAYLSPYGADASGTPTSIYNYEISRMIPVNFLSHTIFTSATMDQPSITLINNNSQNRMTLAASELVYPVTFNIGENEDGGVGFDIEIGLFKYPTKKMDNYSVKIRFDSRDIHFNESQRDLVSFWKSEHHLKFAPIPEKAYMPFYSTWYALKADGVNAENVELQASLAKKLGCETIIVDDGWQKALNAKDGYFLYNGDWEVDKARFPDFKAHVKKVKALGMDYMLWVGPSMVGEQSKVYERFKDKMLYKADWAKGWVIDPRFPEVREFIIERLVTLMKENGIDGYKIDFMDLLNTRYAGENFSTGNGRDYESVEEAAVKLLADIYSACYAINPNVMIEYRQFYTNPLLQQYANMFRAVDCPNDIMENRTRTLDARNLNQQVIHADPLVWNERENPEHAALQMLHTMLSVPQVSTDLTKMDDNHLKMLKFLLNVWSDYKEVLTLGKAFNHGPESHYTWSETNLEDQTVIVAYQNTVLNPKMLNQESLIINGTHQNALILDLDHDFGTRSIEVFNCTGDLVFTDSVEFKGLVKINVPVSGIIKVKSL